ncbi:MAG: hypothetical protein ACK559_03550, partial [bacterium]
MSESRAAGEHRAPARRAQETATDGPQEFQEVLDPRRTVRPCGGIAAAERRRSVDRRDGGEHRRCDRAAGRG